MTINTRWLFLPNCLLFKYTYLSNQAPIFLKISSSLKLAVHQLVSLDLIEVWKHLLKVKRLLLHTNRGWGKREQSGGWIEPRGGCLAEEESHAVAEKGKEGRRKREEEAYCKGGRHDRRCFWRSLARRRRPERWRSWWRARSGYGANRDLGDEGEKRVWYVWT